MQSLFELEHADVNFSDYPRHLDRLPPLSDQRGDYVLDYARNVSDLDEVFCLRYRVFNVEMSEGLDAAHAYQRDFDTYDPGCHHIIVRHVPSQKIIGTYRVQTLTMAGDQGFYSYHEFGLDALPSALLHDAVEVGRACIDAQHRNGRVLVMLWRGVTQYLAFNRMRYLFGCCSINSQNPAEGYAVLHWLHNHGYLHPSLQVETQPAYACVYRPEEFQDVKVNIPTLMNLYLQYDVKVLGGPAIDREFKTIDYFVLFDSEFISEKMRKLLTA